MDRDNTVTPGTDPKVVDFPDQGTLEAEASAWIVRLDKGALSAEDERAFDAWRSTSAEHQAALDGMSGLWRTLDGLSDLQDRSNTTLNPTWLERAGFELRHRVVASLASVAAAVLLVVFVGPFTFSDPHYMQAHRTVVGTQKTVTLPDGSVLLLNTNSHVDVEYSDQKRDVYLHKGEVHFTVAKDKERPFSVYADERVVTATGTAFAVMRRETGIEVTVTEGDVKLYFSPEADANPATLEQASIRSTVANLTAGEKVIFAETLEQVEVIPEPELNRKLAWRQGVLAFAGEPLSDVIAEVSRYTEIDIIIEDPALNELRFGGFFKVGNIEALFDALEQSFGVDVKRDPNSKVYLSATRM
ncbi:MAG: FecR domain-containing protein [Rhodospirillaceae bacterium]